MILKKRSLYYMEPALMEYIARGDSLDVLKYFILQRGLININTIFVLSVKYNSLKIFNYLASFTRNNNNKKRKTAIGSSPSSIEAIVNEKERGYYHALSVVPFSGNMLLFKYLLDKVDIRNTIVNKTNNNNEYWFIIAFIINSAEYGRSEMLDHLFSLFESDKYLLEDILINHSPTIFKIIIRFGQLNIAKQYYSNMYIDIQNKLQNIDLLSDCIRYNQFEMMKYFHENRLGSNKSNRPIDFAIKNRNLEMIKWLHENRTEHCSTHAMDGAASNGLLEIVKWLHENRSEGCTTHAIDGAAQKGHLETIKWLHYNRTEGCTTSAMNYASWSGHLETIKWLHHNRTEGCLTNAMDIAAENGQFETIKWLHENRTEGCTTYAMDNAALNGHLEIMKWLHHNRSEGCTSKAMDNAAENGYFEIVKWLHENRSEGCSPNAKKNASRNGHFEILKLL